MGNGTFKKIYEEYFEILDDYFKGLYREPFSDPLKASTKFVEMPIASDIIKESLDDLKEDIGSFWQKNIPKLRVEVNRLDGLRACYGGDISPSEGPRFISKIGLYVDTILLHDPIFAICFTVKDTSAEKSYLYYLIKHAFNILNLKECLIADTKRPILILYPRTSPFEKELFDEITMQGQTDSIEYFNKLLDTRFNSWSKLQTFLSKQNDPDSLADSIKNRDMLPPYLREGDVSKSLLENHERAIRDFPELRTSSLGDTLRTYITGSLMSATDTIYYGSRFSSEPLYDSPNSYHMFKWKLQKDNEIIAKEKGISLNPDNLVINALQIDNFKWLGDIPLNKLIILRENGELSDLREILRKEINEIKLANDEDFNETAKQINYNLTEAFTKHQNEIKKIEETYKREYKISAGLLIIGGIAGITSLFNPLAALATCIGGKGIIDILSVKDWKKRESEKFKNRPVGLLFSAYSSLE